MSRKLLVQTKISRQLHPLRGIKSLDEAGPEDLSFLSNPRYMEKLAKRLGCPHTGSVIRGGVEGIQVQPPWMTRKLFRSFYRLGVGYAAAGRFNEEIIRKLTPRERMSFGRRFFFRLLNLTGLTNMFWNMKLKENNAFEKRFANPFKEF